MKTYKIKIERDENAWNPRDDDSITTMVCFHKRYDLGDKNNIDSDAYDGWDKMEEAVIVKYGVLARAPLYMYEHGGITIATSPFNCRFDSGRLGFVMITKDSLMGIFGHTDFTQAQLQEMIEAEVKQYNSYLQGDVYQYSIYEVQKCSLGHEHEELLDDCGGYYSEEEARAEAEGIVKVYEERTAIAYHG